MDAHYSKSTNPDLGQPLPGVHLLPGGREVGALHLPEGAVLQGEVSQQTRGGMLQSGGNKDSLLLSHNHQVEGIGIIQLS